MSDNDAKRLQRKQEIEEKRQRLREMRLKKNTAAAKSTSLKAAADVSVPDATKTRAAETSVDELLSTIQKTTEKAAPTDSAASSHPVLGLGEKIELGKVNKLYSVDVQPKPIVRYYRGVNTEATSLGGEDSGEELERGEEKDGESSGTGKGSPKISRRQQQLIEAAEEAEAKRKAEEAMVARKMTEEDRTAVMATSRFHDFIAKNISPVERVLHVNSEYDVMVNYARDLDQEGEKGKVVKTSKDGEVVFQVEFYSDRYCKHRSITDVAFHPTRPELLLASYSEAEAGNTESNGLVLLWSLQNTLERPEFVFTCQSQVCSAAFSPFDSRIVIGGTYCGQIIIWDVRSKTSSPVLQSPLSNAGHTHPVYSLAVVGTQHAHNLVSVSTDGRMCAWRLDDLRQPVEVQELSTKAGKSTATTSPTNPIGVTCIEFSGEDTNAFLVGSEESTVYRTHRHGSKKGELTLYRGHAGPITSVSAHPRGGPTDLSDLFLSSSMDWSIRLWNYKNEEGEAIHSLEDCDDYISEVQWSPTHPAVFASADGTGMLSLWNLNEETDIPVSKTQVSAQALNKITWAPAGDKIAVGTSTTDESGGVLKIFDTTDWASPDIGEWARMAKTLRELGME